MGQGALLEPKDQKLHDMAVEFARKELQNGDQLNLTQFAKCWVALKDGKAVGLMGYVLRPDIPVIRAIDEDALSQMAGRLQSFFADNGWRGGEVFVHIAKRELPEQRCAGWKQVLITEQDAHSADRFVIKVR